MELNQAIILMEYEQMKNNKLYALCRENNTETEMTKDYALVAEAIETVLCAVRERV